MAEKILIVDDDVDSLKLIGLMLQRHGYEVSAANGGNQALAKAHKEQPDLVILDVMMPDMSGYEVCRRLRANSDTADIPIIMFTAKTLIDDKVAGFEAGADDYLTKPTHPAELASRVKSILQRTANRRHANKSHGTTIGVIGVKGGVGASTIAANLGAAFIGMEANPVVVDFRLGNGSLGLELGLGRHTGLANLLGRPASEINTETVQREIVTHQSGLRLLLSSSRPSEAMLNFSMETAHAVVESLREIGKPAICDLGSGYSELIASLHPAMDTIVLLLDPAGVTLSMARELLHELGAENKDRIRLAVINRSKLSQQPTWHEVEHVLEHEISAIVSAAPDLAYQAMESATTIVNYQPNAIVSSQIVKLAQELQTQPE